MSTQYTIPDIDTQTLQLVTPEQAWHYEIVPKASSDESISFYTSEHNYNNNVGMELEMVFGKKIIADFISPQQLKQVLSKYYRRTRNQSRATSLSGQSFDADFLKQLIGEAKNIGASDIHIEKYEQKARIRNRIDGKLIERYILEPSEFPALVNKIKIMANLDIAEKRLPQDGRIYFHDMGSKFDIRVSVLPTLYGEKVVMRILSNDATNIDIQELGMLDKEVEDYLESVRKPNGMMLISGPTGSGKTTTLYATLKLLNEESRNITTIEDPIEYTLEGINQVQLKESIGLDFASAMRTFLRQDPDVIMVGEIRDTQTANMAIRASLTGHLVLSTIHTNSAWGTVSRLIDMGVPSYLLANTLNCSVAQRLVRKLCPSCKKPKDFDIKELPKNYELPFLPKQVFEPVGCDECYHTGYRGRQAVYEIIPIDSELADCIKNAKFEVSDLLKDRQIKTLSENAFELMAKGATSVEEVYPLLLNF